MPSVSDGCRNPRASKEGDVRQIIANIGDFLIAHTDGGTDLLIGRHLFQMILVDVGHSGSPR